jgi:hypothetical protein
MIHALGGREGVKVASCTAASDVGVLGSLSEESYESESESESEVSSRA